MKRYPFIMRRVGALHLFFDGFIPQNAFFQQLSIFLSFLHNVILLALMFKSWYKANAVWHELLMKKRINFLKINNQEEEDERRGGGGGGGGGKLRR